MPPGPSNLGRLVTARRGGSGPTRTDEAVGRPADLWNRARSDLVGDTVRGVLFGRVVATAPGAAAGAEGDGVDTGA